MCPTSLEVALPAPSLLWVSLVLLLFLILARMVFPVGLREVLSSLGVHRVLLVYVMHEEVETIVVQALDC